MLLLLLLQTLLRSLIALPRGRRTQHPTSIRSSIHQSLSEICAQPSCLHVVRLFDTRHHHAT